MNTRKIELRHKLETIKYNEESDINIFVAELQNIIDELEKIDNDMEPSTKVGILNRALPENLRFINVFQYKDNWNKCRDYVTNVIPEIISSNLKESSKLNSQNNNIFLAESKENTNRKKTKKENPTTKNGRCNFCGKWGHYFRECRKRKTNKSIIKKGRKFTKYKRNNFKRKTFKSKRYANSLGKNNYDTTFSNAFTKDINNYENLDDNASNLSLNIATITNNNTNKFNKKDMICWTLDSGASVNITNHLNILKNIKKNNERIYLANNQYITTKFIGDLTGYVNNHKITINNVYYSPEINNNLISISNLIKQGFKIVFNTSSNKPCAILYNQDSQRIISIPSNNSNTFKIWMSTHPLNFTNSNYDTNYSNELNYIHMKSIDKINLWHRRFAHFNINGIKNKLLKINIHTKCPLCANSKLKNKPFQPSDNKSKFTFELIHMDLVGPIPDSIYGSKYFFTILDDFSRYSWILFLKNKNETFNLFFNWFNQIKNQFNQRIKYIRTDNGTEFKNNLFNQYCYNYGIKHQFTVPYNPQQNGRAERLNSTLINTAKTMLNDAKLSYQFWEDSVATANYIHNRLPHKGINNRIPFETLTKRKVYYNNIRVFGCKVFYFIPKTFRSKFQNNASPGIFLGYRNERDTQIRENNRQH